MNKTIFEVARSAAHWRFCAVVDRAGVLDYLHGYARGAMPTRAALQTHSTSQLDRTLRVLDIAVMPVKALTNHPTDGPQCCR